MNPMIAHALPASEAYIRTPTENARRLLLHATAAGQCGYCEGFKMAQRAPADYLLGAVLSGEVRFKVGGIIQRAVKSDLLLFPPETPRTFVSDSGFNLLWVEFNGPPAEGYYNIIAPGENFIFHSENLSAIQKTLRELVQALKASPAVSDARLSLLLTNVLAQLCDAPRQEDDESESAAMERVLHRIVTGVANPPSVNEMADEMGFSPSHFIRVFSRHTGLTPRQYIISIRMERAKHLLTTTRLPLRSIAELVGYTSESMFCSAFHRSVNVTARQYRAIAANQVVPEAEELMRLISDAVIEGNSINVGMLCQRALAGGATVRGTLDTMMNAMSVVDSLYARKEIPLSDMLSSARAIKNGLGVLKPHMPPNRVPDKAIIGTVSGDLHDIGKNLVAMMLESVSFEIVDLGVDVSAQQFADAFEANPDAKLIVISALLISSRPVMGNTVRFMNAQSFRKDVKILVGGAAVTEDFAREIGVDAYTPDAVSAARKARELVEIPARNCL